MAKREFLSRGTGGLFLVVAVVAGLLAAFLVYQLLSSSTARVDVVVAAKEIAPGEKILPESAVVHSLPAAGVNADAVKDVSAVVGKHARTAILKGSVVRPGMVAELAGAGGTIPAKVGSAGRGMALSLEILGGVLPAPGDRVDVIAVINAPVQSNAPSTAATVVRGAEVLEVKPGEDSSGEKGHFVVRVTPKEAELLSLALAHGKVFATVAGLDAVPADTAGSSLLEIWKGNVRAQ